MRDEHPVQTYYRKQHSKYMAELRGVSVDNYLVFLRKKWADKDAAEGNKMLMIDGDPTLVKAKS